jgi:hypothetical protein
LLFVAKAIPMPIAPAAGLCAILGSALGAPGDIASLAAAIHALMQRTYL